MEKINVEEINVVTVVNDYYTKGTIEVLLEQQILFAKKINEIIDVLDKKEEFICKNHGEGMGCDQCTWIDKTWKISAPEEECEYCEKCGCGRMGNIYIHDLKDKSSDCKNDWEKEFDE